MSLFKFGFSKRQSNNAVATVVSPAISSSANNIQPIVIADTTEAREQSDLDTLNLTASSNIVAVTAHLTTPIATMRDPAFPVALDDLDAEIRLGAIPVVSDSSQSSGRSGRGFRKEWVETRQWLEYSNTSEKSYCFPCRLFGKGMTGGQIRGHDSFITRGFNDWKNAQRGFSKHESSELHETCDEMLKNRARQLTDATVNPCISASLSAAFRQRQLQNEQAKLVNRGYIGRLANVMRLLMRLGLAVRGHREDEGSLHRGNFREFLELVRVNDSFLDTQMSSRPGNAHYLSPESQNDFIEAIGDEVLNTIIIEARNAEFFAITMDETTDLAHLEQISIVVRYCDKQFNAVERLLALTESSVVTGQALADIMISTLQRYGFHLDRLCAQTYDGAAAMSGVHRGVQTIIRQLAPQAHYNHCRSHSSNLVVVKSAQTTAFGRNFFGVLEQLFVTIEGSAKRHDWFMESQASAGLKPKALKALSDTRWNCQGRSVEVVRSRLSAINTTLRKIRDESGDRKVIGEVVGLLACTNKFEFALAIVFFAKLLSPLDTLTRALQGPDATLHTVVVLSEGARCSIEELRNNLDGVMSEAIQLAEQSDIDTEPEDKRPKKVSRRIDSGANEVTLSAVSDLKRQLLEITDIALSELKIRFSDNAGRMYAMVGALMTHDTTCAELRSHIDALYPNATDTDQAVAQFEVVRHISGWRTADTLQKRAAACPPSMIELRRIYTVMITVPVTSAGCERTFSKLAIIKSKLRTTCGQERLERLVMCSVERDIVQNLNMDNIIDRFATKSDGKNRRIHLNK